MAFLIHVCQPAAALFAALICLCFVARFTPARRLSWRVTLLPLFILVWPGGTWLYARHSLREWLLTNCEVLSRESEQGTQYAYLVNDYVPAYRLLGGQVPPEVRAFVHAVEKGRPPCSRQNAHEKLGEPVPDKVRAACSASRESPPSP